MRTARPAPVGPALHFGLPFDSKADLEFEHYPPDDVYDPETHAQYYFHAHSPGGREWSDYGHFHIFLRPKCMPPGIRPMPIPGSEPPPSENDALCHLVAISTTREGLPERLFTTNRWVTAETWYAGEDAIRMLEHCVFDVAWPSWPLNRWLTAMLVLFRPQIEQLILQRDETVREPLTRRNVMVLVRSLGGLVRNGDLNEVTLTTNGTQLARVACELLEAGGRRVNVSLDTLDPARFSAITRLGSLERVLDGIAAAKKAGLVVKINMVVQQAVNDDEIDAMIAWCGFHGFDLSFIEPMPMGTGHQTGVPFDELLNRLCRRWTLSPSEHATGGPARYVMVAETGRRIGFISPLSHGFYGSCNRLRVTCSGQLYMCLGAAGFVDLRAPLRASQGDALLEQAIDDAVACRPEGHSFALLAARGEGSGRVMSLTGG